jgi:hypothetical protein
MTTPQQPISSGFTAEPGSSDERSLVLLAEIAAGGQPRHKEAG